MNQTQATRNTTTEAYDETLAPRIIEAWKILDQYEGRLYDIHQSHGEDSEAWEAMNEKVEGLAFTFDDLVDNAYQSGHMEAVLADVENLASDETAHLLDPNDFYSLKEKMADAHGNFGVPGALKDGTLCDIRTVCFGIPLTGIKENMVEIIGSNEFAALACKTGFAPQKSNILIAGLLTASDAMVLAHDPKRVWELVKSFQKNNGTAIDDEIVPNLMMARKASHRPDQVQIGGYVAVMMGLAISSEEEDGEFQAVDFPDEETVENWMHAIADFHVKHPDIGVLIDPPCSLGDAARSAIASQLTQSLLIERGMEDGNGDIPSISRIGILIASEEGPIGLMARFEDDTEVLIENALGEDFIPFVVSLADAFERPTALIIDGDMQHWDALLLQDDDLGGAPPRSKMH